MIADVAVIVATVAPAVLIAGEGQGTKGVAGAAVGVSVGVGVVVRVVVGSSRSDE